MCFNHGVAFADSLHGWITDIVGVAVSHVTQLVLVLCEGELGRTRDDLWSRDTVLVLAEATFRGSFIVCLLCSGPR